MRTGLICGGAKTTERATGDLCEVWPRPVPPLDDLARGANERSALKRKRDILQEGAHGQRAAAGTHCR
jgi:hypothetical protein